MNGDPWEEKELREDLGALEKEAREGGEAPPEWFGEVKGKVEEVPLVEEMPPEGVPSWVQTLEDSIAKASILAADNPGRRAELNQLLGRRLSDDLMRKTLNDLIARWAAADEREERMRPTPVEETLKREEEEEYIREKRKAEIGRTKAIGTAAKIGTAVAGLHLAKTLLKPVGGAARETAKFAVKTVPETAMKGTRNLLGVPISHRVPSSVAPTVGKFYTVPKGAVPGAPMVKPSYTPPRAAQAMVPGMSPAAVSLMPGAPMTGLGMDLSGLRDIQTRAPSMMPSGMPSVLAARGPMPTPTIPTRHPMPMPRPSLEISEEPQELRRELEPGEAVVEEFDQPVYYWIGPKQRWVLGEGKSYITRMATGSYRFRGTATGRPRSKIIGKDIENAPEVAAKRT